MKVLSPLVMLVNFITNGFIRLLGVKADHTVEDHLSSEELRTVVNEAGGLILVVTKTCWCLFSISNTLL